MQTSVNFKSVSKNPSKGVIGKRTQVVTPTFEVTQLSNSVLGSKRGVQLPKLMVKGQILPYQVANARFHVVESDPRPLSDQQFNALIKRLVKCFMSEVEITRRLRKATTHSSGNPTDLNLIRRLESLRRNYESERSVLVVKLSLDSRFNLQSSYAKAEKIQQSKSIKPRKSNPLDTHSKSFKVPQKIKSCKHEYDVRPSQRQSGGYCYPKYSPRRAIVCNRIDKSPGPSHHLREKLYRLLETSIPPLESAQTKESFEDPKAFVDSDIKDSISAVSPCSSDTFFDIPDMVDFQK
ncbi:uncharacterized protein LOC108115331 [Drosophila eugracilis]|uniref:uncharacterized protein LOC108115331 n=1 Tax=Drosophila eugracilis TaxID=29029 RepID=UPI0007E822D4|nr:uncharacterized protein LOC108115331 [Drosophila eugracilis]